MRQCPVPCVETGSRMWVDTESRCMPLCYTEPEWNKATGQTFKRPPSWFYTHTYSTYSIWITPWCVYTLGAVRLDSWEGSNHQNNLSGTPWKISQLIRLQWKAIQKQSEPYTESEKFCGFKWSLWQWVVRNCNYGNMNTSTSEETATPLSPCLSFTLFYFIHHDFSIKSADFVHVSLTVGLSHCVAKHIMLTTFVSDYYVKIVASCWYMSLN